MSDPTSSVISQDLSLSCALLSRRCSGFTFPPLISWNVLLRKGALLDHTCCPSFLMLLSPSVIKAEIATVCRSVLWLCLQWSHSHDAYARHVAYQNSFQPYLCSWVCLPPLPASNWIWGLLGGQRRRVGGRVRMNEAKIEGGTWVCVWGRKGKKKEEEEESEISNQ